MKCQATANPDPIPGWMHMMKSSRRSASHPARRRSANSPGSVPILSKMPAVALHPSGGETLSPNAPRISIFCIGWPGIGLRASALPPVVHSLSARTRDEGYHAGKTFVDRRVVFVSLAVRRSGIPGAGAGGQAGTAIADTERDEHNCSLATGIGATATTPAAPGTRATQGRPAGWRKVRHQVGSGVRAQVRRGVRSHYRLVSYQASERTGLAG
jgi:hypothetical protein